MEAYAWSFFFSCLLAGGRHCSPSACGGISLVGGREPLLGFVARQGLRLNCLARAIEAYLGWSQ